MKVPIYLRIGKRSRKNKGDSFKIEAASKPCDIPLMIDNYGTKTYLPTIFFGVEFEIPDEMFKQASTLIALINVTTKEAKISKNILIP